LAVAAPCQHLALTVVEFAAKISYAKMVATASSITAGEQVDEVHLFNLKVRARAIFTSDS
jgi:hypothetical protein